MIRTSKKAHTCYRCNTPIEAGSRYADHRDRRAMGEAFRYHLTCRPCHRGDITTDRKFRAKERNNQPSTFVVLY